MNFLAWSATLLPTGDNNKEPWKHLPVWLAVAFALRATIALGSDYAIHPDEILQYLEPAHRLVFGYGIVSWEYQFGGRSWIIPGLVASILWSLDKADLGVPWVYVYVVKLAFCAISMLIPWGAYHFSRRVLGESSARMALALICLWPFVVSFAHKPFTEFVSTSLLFGALGLACRPASSSKKGAFAFGAIIALAAAIRMQYLPVAALVWLARFAVAGKPWALASIAGGVTIIAMVAVLETLTWGAPFHSYYVNFVFNQELDKSREVQGFLYYFPRLLFVTAGGALVMLYAFFRTPKRHMLVLAQTIAILAIHMFAQHKELRFVFCLLPLCLIVMGDQLTLWSNRWPRWFGLRSVTVVSSMLMLVVGSNLLITKDNKLDVYLSLSKLEDVKGVFHFGDYIATAGYYYMHHDVPLYDFDTYESVVEKEGIDYIGELVSHVVAPSDSPDILDIVKIGGIGKDYTYGFVKGTVNVREWKQHSPIVINKSSLQIAKYRLGFDETDEFTVFEFADQPKP